MSFVYHVGATAICPHAAPINVVPGNARVRVSGQPVATMADQFLIGGCPFNVSGAPLPCIQVQWLVPAMRVRAGGQPLILQSSTGLCMGAGPPGPPSIVATQPRVKGM